MEREITKMIRVYGIVQGVGFRPTVSRHAMARGIRGSVSNKGPYVEIFAQGKQQDVDAFIADIGNKPPKRAAICTFLSFFCILQDLRIREDSSSVLHTYGRYYFCTFPLPPA